MSGASAKEVVAALNARIGDLARELLGEPNRELSTPTQLRFGTHGSIAVELEGDDAGRWFDHEHGIGGAGIETAAAANVAALAARDGHIDGTLRQDSAAVVFSSNSGAVQYAPGTTTFSSQALGNVVSYNGTAPASQDLRLEQRNTGPLVQAGTSANAGNSWDLAGRARAGGNQGVFANQGGSSVVEAQQDNAARVWAESIVTSYYWHFVDVVWIALFFTIYVLK